ncbi:EboA domain-containing protein [Allostreptomyces psammosilenae]|uniref:Sugar phosphate isomerase/epimerase n=1 Tax=Allostreptomyces psammosilenae TaxID=1892865 RepID=A0A852ZYE5_9ACTN|nr:EboA domain-containing protein [Allostreptomyces psammosilenae]NYI07403.1 sugar phosphate isomerase/epimerase [Allostreptomyces psammosilenae]
MRFGYGTNGFGDHRLADALDVIAELGYSGVALTLDHHHLDPWDPGLPRRTEDLARRLDRLGLDVVVETGARYLLDRHRKHQPTLLSEPEGARLRVDLLRRAVRVAADLGAQAVSFWSGTPDAVLPAEEAWRRLEAGCREVLTEAQRYGVILGFEPEPGMFVDTLAGYGELRDRLGAPEGFGLTLDIGHCRCLEDGAIPDLVTAWGGEVVNVQIDDMRRGVHEHLEFGTGEIDFPPVLAALEATGYRGLVSVELPRHGHAAPRVARESLRFLHHAADTAGVPVTGPRPTAVSRPASALTSMPADSVTDAAPAAPTDPLATLATALRAAVPPPADAELAALRAEVTADPDRLPLLLPRAARLAGERPLHAGPAASPEHTGGWSLADAARVLLLAAPVLVGKPYVDLLVDAYRGGDADERRAVLHTLDFTGPRLSDPDAVAAVVQVLLLDALRTNDTRLVAAALGPWGAAVLPAPAWRQAVLKCLFTGIPLAAVGGLPERVDAELLRMVGDFAAERTAAGRPVPDDALAVLRLGRS